MKAMTRQELAVRAGVTVKTLNNYIRHHKETLQKLGMRPREILPPRVVEWIVSNYGISLDESVK